MRLILALRLFKDWHAKCGIEALSKTGLSRGRLVNLHAERQHPALRNIAEYLRDSGKLPVVRCGEVLSGGLGLKATVTEGDCRVFWCEVESNIPVAEWESKSEVEAVIIKSEFEALANKIRHRSGTEYVKACEEFSNRLRTRTVRTVRYRPPSTSKDQAA